MAASRSTEDKVEAAIDRLISRNCTTSQCDLLIDKNLVIESGVKRATVYRCDAIKRWKLAKEESVRSAFIILADAKRADKSLELSDKLLFDTARIDYAAFHKMPDELMFEWQSMKAYTPRKSRRSEAGVNADEVIDTLVNQLYGTTLALRKSLKTISKLTAEIERLGGNVVPLAKEAR